MRKISLESDIPSVLYHYTGFDALESILEQKELWLSNCCTSNDSKELKYYIECLQHNLFDLLGNELDKDAMLQTCNEVIKRLEEYPAYIFCFSKLKDDAAQWDRYGHRGEGVCIAFNRDKIKWQKRWPSFFAPVEYDAMKKTKELARIIYEVKDVDGGAEEFIKKDKWEACLYKHPSFASEQEYRIGLYPNCYEITGLEKKRKFLSKRISEYYALPLGNRFIKFEHCFSGIIIGPKAKVTVLELKQYIQSLGYNSLASKVTKSECPLQ